MKTIVIYQSKKGATRQLAEKIAGQLGEAVCHDIGSGAPPALDRFDCVVLGSGLTAGQIGGKLKEFMRRQQDVLTGKRLGLFLSGLDQENAQVYLAKSFPAGLLERSAATAFLGGIYDPAGCGWLTRAMMKKIIGRDEYTCTINEAAIDAFTGRLLE